VESIDVVTLHWELDFQAIAFSGSFLMHLDNGGETFLTDEGAEDLLHAIEVHRNGKGLTVAERRLRTETESADEIVRLVLGATEVRGVEVVDILFTQPDTEVPDAEPRFQTVREVDLEGNADLASSHMTVPGIAGELTDDGSYLITVEPIGQNPEALDVVVDLERPLGSNGGSDLNIPSFLHACELHGLPPTLDYVILPEIDNKII
jgi:hypothetical protein